MAQKAPKPFVAVYNALSPSLTRFVAKRLGSDYTKTEEILQNTAIAAWRSWSSFKHKSTYFTWLCRIALNKIADYYKGQINERSKLIYPGLKYISLIESPELSPVERLSINELRSSVNDCLNLMPKSKRKLLQYKFWKGLTHKQIAKILDISERAVEGRLYRAKQSFAHFYAQQSKS